MAPRTCSRRPGTHEPPPRLPETAARVLGEAEVGALVAMAGGRTFDDRRDAAILRAFLDAGLGLAELAALRQDPRPEGGERCRA
jgi:site-specific recombinase XerC